ncbi:hypothetical protein DYB38_011065 [Aphanomyces astaci]|uniref:Uncharacterized protein n=1 Tax=Aphanomyces astaci TaxID=112090 RepID=A0A397DPX1_APHAT|nr:hypothetical protein DYB38_011065 [Aphanomyces astaci]
MRTKSLSSDERLYTSTTIDLRRPGKHMSASFLIHRYDDAEELNPFLTVTVCEEDKLPPMKGKSPVVIKLRLLHVNWQHGKQLFVNALVVVCLVCIGIIPLVSWPRQHSSLQFSRKELQMSNDHAVQDELSQFRHFQAANNNQRRHRGHISSSSGLHAIAADKVKGPRAWRPVEQATRAAEVQANDSDNENPPVDAHSTSDESHVESTPPEETNDGDIDPPSNSAGIGRERNE